MAPGAGAVDMPDAASLALWTLLRPGYVSALFVAGWGFNVLVFERRRVDYAAALGLAQDELPSPARLLALALAGVAALGAAHSAAAIEGPSLVGLGCVLLLYVAVAFAVLGSLPPVLARRLPPARAAFARALRRCFWPEPGKEVPFVQVLVADGLTSLARAFFDLALGSCALVGAAGGSGAFGRLGAGGHGADGLPHASLLATHLEVCNRSPVPFIAWAAPFLIRARQCWVSSRNAPDALSRLLHLVNLAKYASALPVIRLAFLRAQAGDDAEGAEDLEMLGALACIVNTAFCYLWDLSMDWGLLHPAPLGSGRFGLRPALLLCSGGGFYYLAIGADALARAGWTMRWSPEAVRLGGFWLGSLLQSVEVSRRALWSVLRVEWQCVRSGAAARPLPAKGSRKGDVEEDDEDAAGSEMEAIVAAAA